MPSKEDPAIGTITVNGKASEINIKNSLHNINKEKYKKTTEATKNDINGNIVLSKNFFKKKGSNHNERRDAALQHEIGHHRTLNPYYMNGKDKDKISDVAEYSKKYEKGEHATPEEFLADRYAANRTSEKGLKRSIRNSYKFTRKENLNKDDEEKRKYNKKADQDYVQRNKALKDTKLKKFDIED